MDPKRLSLEEIEYWADKFSILMAMDSFTPMRLAKEHWHKKVGKYYTLPCPFKHEDGRRCEGTVNVSHEKNIWKCFDCGAGGMAIQWVMMVRDISAREAAQLLYDKTIQDIAEA